VFGQLDRIGRRHRPDVDHDRDPPGRRLHHDRRDVFPFGDGEQRTNRRSSRRVDAAEVLAGEEIDELFAGGEVGRPSGVVGVSMPPDAGERRGITTPGPHHGGVVIRIVVGTFPTCRIGLALGNVPHERPVLLVFRAALAVALAALGALLGGLALLQHRLADGADVEHVGRELDVRL